MVCICIIYVYATQTARRLIFNGFWLTHKLIVIMYILTILHGASTIVQKPMFFAYFIGPAIIFTIDKMISMSRKKTELDVIRAEKLPSGTQKKEFFKSNFYSYDSKKIIPKLEKLLNELLSIERRNFILLCLVQKRGRGYFVISIFWTAIWFGKHPFLLSKEAFMIL